ncbi:MAG: class I SAM-dependent methyltransferase [Oscillospiraceae bacterium]
MQQLRLSPRLSAISALIPFTGAVADIGTDHGYLPVWLAQQGFKGGIFATDINEGPLEHAKATAAEFGVSPQIHFQLCDGLALCPSAEIKTLVIAGMGGETISDIIANAPWAKENNCLLVLQPMTKSAFLRKRLFENGYRVLSEQLVRDGAVYEILSAVPGTDIPYSPAELLIGHRALICADPLFPEALEKLIEKTRAAIAGLSAAQRAANAEKSEELSKTLSDLLSIQNSMNKEANHDKA